MNANTPKEQADACSLCGKCKTVCPTFQEVRKETMSSRGRIQLSASFDELASGKASKDFVQAISTCLLCLRCSSVCPNQVQIEKAIIPTRHSIIDRNGQSFIESFLFKYVISRRRRLSWAVKALGISDKLVELSRLESIYRTLLETGMGVSADRKMPKFKIKNFYHKKPALLPSKANRETVIYFPGCSASLVLTEIAEATTRLLLASGANVLLPRLPCCGMPVYASGDLKQLESMARANAATLLQTGCSKIITSCGSCGTMIGRIYKDILGATNAPFEVLDISQYLMRYPVKPVHALEKKVTYHDPCHLKRGMGVYEEPRQLLKAIPGLDLVEMEESDSCCGAGGAVSLKAYDLTKQVRKGKIHRFQRTQAELLTTGCPACILHLEDGMQEHGLRAKVVHPVTLLAQSVEL